MGKALEGLSIIDLTRVLAGPYCTMVLADLGAEVIKVEIPGRGDDSRDFGPFIHGESTYFMSLNRNKRSLTLNLKSRRGKEIFTRLVRGSDVLVENFRPGTMERLGFGQQRVREINPQLIYAACSGFGQSGPDRDKPCYDGIAQARSGLMSITGPDERNPTRVGSSIADIVAGLFTAIGILSALKARGETGEGQMVDVAMLDCQVAILENALARFQVTGEVPRPQGNRHPSIVPFESFATADDLIMVAAGNDLLWARLCEALGREDLAGDGRFRTNRLRKENYDQLRPRLADTFKTRTTGEWMERIEAMGVPCSPINDISQVVEDEQIQARKMLVGVEHPTAGSLNLPNTPVKLSGTPGGIDEPAPLLGEDNVEILGQLGYSADEVRNLKEDGVI